MDFDWNVKLNSRAHTCVRPGTDIVPSFGTSYPSFE